MRPAPISNNAQPETASTSALNAIIQGYCAMIIASAGRASQTLRHVQKLRRHIRRLCQIDLVDFARQRRQDIAQYPTLRAQVRADLGGRPAMVKWELRRRGQKTRNAHRQARQAQQSYNVINHYTYNRDDNPRASRTPWQPKTDRFGQYRLAAIPTGPRSMSSRSSRKSSKITVNTASRDMTLRLHPIPLTAEELRDPPPFSSGYTPTLNSVAPQTGHASPPLRPPI